MPSNKLKEIAAYKAKIASLEKAVELEQKKKLANLHLEVDLESTKALIAALQNLKKSPRKAAKAAKAAKKGTRARISQAMKIEVGKAVESGKKGAEIARQFGISIPSIQNIKKELGLVKKRGAAKATTKTAKKPARKATRKTAAKRAAKKTAEKAVETPAE